MSYRVFIIPRRNDIGGMNVQVLDLSPNNSQKNNNLDGVGQTGYIPPGIDYPGTTKVNGNAYVSGSRWTTPLTDAALADTTGLGNDCRATSVAEFGLAAYLREKVQPGGTALATAGRMSIGDAEAQSLALYGYVLDPTTDCDLASINNVLSAGPGGTANTDLDGTAASSRSFGSVEEILRIVAGEVYRTPQNTIITNAANQFLTEAARDVLVDAQVTATTGTTFVSTGGFLESTESGYVGIPVLAFTEEVLGSLQPTGDLHALKANMAFKNPVFAYSAAEVSVAKPIRAFYLELGAGPIYIGANGVAPSVVVVDNEGTKY